MNEENTPIEILQLKLDDIMLLAKKIEESSKPLVSDKTTNLH